jgi:hypothetical protein
MANVMVDGLKQQAERLAGVMVVLDDQNSHREMMPETWAGRARQIKKPARGQLGLRSAVPIAKAANAGGLCFYG